MAGVRARRAASLASWLAVVFVPAVAVWMYGLRLQPTARFSGWLLAGVVGGLALFGARKKVRVLAIGRASTWLRWHLFGGAASAVLFALHGWYRPAFGFGPPGGAFNRILAALYLGTAASGVVGLVLTRVVPPRLTANGDELIFERLPIYRRELRKRAEAIALQAAGETASTAVADFYSRHLHHFFAAPRHFWGHVAQSRGSRHRLAAVFLAQRRYLDAREQALLSELAALAELKDQADYASAMQVVLKGWLTVHAAVTSALLIWALAHVIIVYTYGAA